MRLKEYEIVIEPREITFEHIEANRVFTKTLNIKNVGNKSKRMELFRPSNKVFCLKYKNPELPVPPGMEIAAIVEFETAKAQEYTDKMVVSIDDVEIDIPIRAFPARPILQVDEIIDFGVLSANNKTVSKKLKITNTGAMDGEFSLDYKGDLPINFNPSRDIVPAYSHLYITVDLFTNMAGEINETIQIKLEQSNKINEFKIKANVILRQLVLLDPKTQAAIKKIDFGSCYYGCNLLNLAILQNTSPEKVDYVILLEEKGLGAEIGAELSKSTNALKAKDTDYSEDDFVPVGKLISAFPNNGTLEPFEKRPIFFRFSPQYKNPSSGFSTTLRLPPRRDYAVFLYFELLGSHQRTELAITGTALPVLLRIEPNKVDFGCCKIGEKKEVPAVLYNDSELKDIRFKFRKVANYTVNPACGRIKARSKRDVLVSFIPHQMGTFNYTFFCDVIDKMTEAENPLVSFDKMICEFPISVFGEAILITTIPEPVYSGGMMPILTNEVGINVNTTLADLKSFAPKIAVQNATRDGLHKLSYAEKVKAGKESEYKVAFPNDRAKSIAPFNRNEKYKTIFTGADRYNYVDPDYAYTDEERERIETHKLVYKKYIEDLRFYRQEKFRNIEFYAFENSKNIGLEPGGGLKAKNLKLAELYQEASKPPKFNVNASWQLITSEELKNQEKLLKNTKPAKENPSAVMTNRERDKISSQLTPAQIYKIIVNPNVIDFGEVCVRSVSIKNLEFLNTLDQPIHVEIENDCTELAQTTPLSQIIQPQSKGIFQIVFESESVQTFQRSISYRINYSYRHHVIILAEIKLPSLKLNTNHLVLNQIADIQPEMCYRSNITVINPFNAVAEFTWIPIYGEQGTAFSIRPATGTIEAFKDLECEVVWHGSFLAPLKGMFTLQVTGGESTTLSCEAKLGQTQLQFINRRANFGKIPINMTSTKTFYMTNTGTHNAYFQVLDPKPIPGLIIKPAFGLAPLNALTPIKVEMTPQEMIKFDARVMIQIRGGKQLELRLSGESEEPLIDIDMENFDFGGVFSGASSFIPFKLLNKSLVKGKVEFNLKRYPDFSIRAADKSTQLIDADRAYELELHQSQSVELELVFSPTEVASYEFDLAISINRTNDRKYSETELATSVTPFQSSEINASINRDKTPVTRKSSRYSVFNSTVKKKVTAIGLRHALLLSSPKIDFKIPIKYLEKLKEGGFYEAKSTLLINQSHRPVKWCFDLRKSNKVLEEGIFKLCDGSMVPFINNDKKSYGPEGEIQPNESCELKILFCPDKPGIYKCNLPIVVNNNFDHPYYNIEVCGELISPEIHFEPNILIFKPVPLGVEIKDQFFIKSRGYESRNKLKLHVPQAKCLDGEMLDVLKVNFVNDPVLNPQEDTLIEVEVKFSSPKPVSSEIKLKFIDEQNREYFFVVVFTSDNSLFTCFPFLAEHNTDYHIVLEQGHVMKGSRLNGEYSPSEQSGEPILRPFTGTSRMSNNRTASPTFDMNPSTPNGAQSSQVNEDVALRAGMNSGMTSNTYRIDSAMSSIYSKAQEQILFPSTETESGIYTYEVLKIIQRWFRCNGWPNSYNLVTIPESFRAGISRKPLEEGLENMPQQDAMKQENKTIYEMIAYLCGRALPAIPVGVPVPPDLAERTTLFYWQHNVLLKFIEAEGGCVSHIKPDHLLDVNEYKCWLEQMKKHKDVEESSGYKKTEIECVDTPKIPFRLFPLVSKKAWLDCLLQLLKSCVVNRITLKTFKNSPVPYNKNESFPDIKPDPLISNIYSMGERILLTWLNYCYANYKSKIWSDNERGGVPPTRWIVNFDVDLTDSLTLAAVIGAYCPFVIDKLRRMYMNADTPEKCFHNALILVECCRKIGLDYDINSLDITEPNSIAMILFCTYLFNKLPNYIPSATIDFSSQLHQTITKQVKISNPCAKNIFYQAILIGDNAEDFTLPNGNELSIQAKGKSNLSVQFTGNTLKPNNCYLLLVGRKHNSMSPDTLVFCLKATIDELSAKKIFKFQSPLYKLTETAIEIENPYNQACEFKVKIVESSTRNGLIKNPFNDDDKLAQKNLSDKSKSTIATSKSVSNSMKRKTSVESLDKKDDIDPDTPVYSAFFSKTVNVFLEPKTKQKIVVSYLPIQFIKHSALILFSNERVGEFIYYLEGTVNLPEPSKILVDESALDLTRIKYIKSNRPEVKTLMFRCYSGDRVEIKLLIPVCNLQRENAIKLATELRMSEVELKRRKVHGVLSSKSLLESLDNLTLNKPPSNTNSSQQAARSVKKTAADVTKPINYKVQVKNCQYLSAQTNVTVNLDEIKSDENLVPLTIKFFADRIGTFQSMIELKSLPNDILLIPIDFKVTEGVASESNNAYLQFNSCVFDSITQPIPIKNTSEAVCNYTVEIDNKGEDKNIFKGLSKFTIKPKDIYIYQLMFTPNAEEKFQGEIRFNNLTEGTQTKYMLTGNGERRPPLGEIKFETKVGQITQHEILIPNKTNRKICFYVFSTTSFIKGPDKIMILPNRKEPYKFEIHPIQRGDFKGVVTFKPGEWPIKDIDSDGEEMALNNNDEKAPEFTLWYTFDLKIHPPPPLSSVELEGYNLDTSVLCIPLSNPFKKRLQFKVMKNGPYLEGHEEIEIEPESKYNYELRFCPKQVGRFKGSLVFLNDETGEFWYELKLLSVDSLPIQMEPIEAEVGRFATKVLKLSNPLNEPIQFKTIISNTNNFGLERKQNDRIRLEPNTTVDVNVIFTPSTVGPSSDHVGLIAFYNEKIGNITYELRGIGIEPDTQDPINITAEIGHSQMVTVNFRNSTDSAIYCDINLLDENQENVMESNENAFNILLNSLENVHVSPRALLDIPIVFTPMQMKRYNVNLVVSARREARMNWAEQTTNKNLEKLEWIYPIKAFSVVNAIHKSTPMILECMVRKRVEKRMEVTLNNVTTYASGQDRNTLRVRSITPERAEVKQSPKLSQSSEEFTDLKSMASSNSLILLNDPQNLSNEFVYSIQFTGGQEQTEIGNNSTALKLVRVQRDKNTGTVTLLFDIIFAPSKSIMNDAYLQVETALGGTWRYPIRFVSIEPPPDDTIIIEAFRLNRESVVGFRLCSKSEKTVPFRAYLTQQSNEQAFTVTPTQGELQPESRNGTLIKVGFTPFSYGKAYQSQLIISTPSYEWKYLVKGVTPEYVIPRGQSGINAPRFDQRLKRTTKKRNYVIENTYIIQTAVSSPIKGASLVPMRFSS